MKNFDKESAVIYARKHALKYNPDFMSFKGLGGDCTNYISQCLLAGGGVMNYSNNGWFYVDSNNRAPSWTGVNFLTNFLLANKTPGFRVEIIKKENLQIGDIVQIRQNPNRFNHTMIVTKAYGGKVFVSAHSNDCLDKSLDDYKYIEIMCLRIIGVNEW